MLIIIIIIILNAYRNIIYEIQQIKEKLNYLKPIRNPILSYQSKNFHFY